MSEIYEKYYDGFEGDDEIIFTLEKKNGEKKEFGIWDGYFDDIMNQIKPEENGWTGLAYYYQLVIGWYDESPWEVKILLESYEQLKNIDINSLKYDEEKEILIKILSMFEEAIDNGEKLYISLE